MATGTSTPNPDNLSEEELEKLTAPDQGVAQASEATQDQAGSPATPLQRAGTEALAGTAVATPAEVKQQEAGQAAAAQEASDANSAAAPSAVDPGPPVADPRPVAAAGGATAAPTPPTSSDPAANSPNPVTTVIPAVPKVEASAEIEEGHTFTGKTVKVHVSIKDLGSFEHVFNVSSEPLVAILNRVVKIKHGIDLKALDGLVITVNGHEVPENGQAHLQNIEDEAEIAVTYD